MFDAREFLQAVFQGESTATVSHREFLSSDKLPPFWHFRWDERSAILEYDAGYPREQAEHLALVEINRLMQEAARRDQ